MVLGYTAEYMRLVQHLFYTHLLLTYGDLTYRDLVIIGTPRAVCKTLS